MSDVATAVAVDHRGRVRRRASLSMAGIFALAVGCGGAETASAPASPCVDVDATTAPDADVAGDDASSTGDGDTPSALDDATPDTITADTHIAIDTGPPDPDDPISCSGMLVPGPAATVCDAVVRLDYDTRGILGWRLVCGAEGWEGDEPRSRMLAQASLGIDLPLDDRMTGFDPAFHHAASATSPGAFAIVHPEIGRVVVAGTTVPGGGALTETVWNPPWDPTRCFPEFELLGAVAVAPEGETIDDGLVKEIARDAWHGPIGAWWEENGGCTKHAYQAGVMRWAPEPGGAYREWIVVIELGTLCLEDD